MTRILFDPRVDLGAELAAATVEVRATPVGWRVDGAVVVIPAVQRFTVTGGTASSGFDLVAPVGFAWAIAVAHHGRILLERVVTFAGSTVDWADLLEVDRSDLSVAYPTGPVQSGGVAGPPGPKGDKGDPGERGPQGDPGATGETGARGAQGNQGARGNDGNTGATGERGERGLPGETGPRGLPGADGEKGDTGAAGAPGATGAKGDTGAQGLPGAKGDTGATGAKGDAGERGLPGETGAKGDPGATGAKGDAGARGEQGARGAAGSGGLRPPLGWLAVPGDAITGNANAPIPAERQTFVPFQVGPVGWTTDAVVVLVTATGGEILVGLYADAGGVPDTSRLLAVATVSLNANSNVIAILSTTVVLEPGVVWISALSVNGTSGQVRIHSNVDWGLAMPPTVSIGTSIRAYRLDGRSSLITEAIDPATMNVSGGNDAPLVALRRSA